MKSIFLGINGLSRLDGVQTEETEAVFDINGIIKFFNINAGSETIGRYAPTPVDLYLSNTTLNGTYEAQNSITVENNVTVGGTTVLMAGNSIDLKPGFTANNGCNFIASIGTVSDETARYYYLKDHLGSIRVTVDEVGDIVGYDDYDPWGVILAGRSSISIDDARYKFTSKERDVETGYDYFGARYYDSRIGRWLQVDPLMDKYLGWSPYNYTLNNPLRFIDSNGKEVKIYSRWSGPGYRHLFIVVKNEKTGIFTSRSLMPAGGIIEGVLTAFPFVKGGNTPVIRKDMESDLGAVIRQEAGEKDVDAHLEMVVQPPSGMSEAEYDEAVLNAADNYPVEKRPYDSDEGPNSNTYVNDVIESTGVQLPQFDKATQQKWADEQKKKEEQKED